MKKMNKMESVVLHHGYEGRSWCPIVGENYGYEGQGWCPIVGESYGYEGRGWCPIVGESGSDPRTGMNGKRLLRSDSTVLQACVLGLSCKD